MMSKQNSESIEAKEIEQPSAASKEQGSGAGRLKVYFWVFAWIVGLVHVWAGRHQTPCPDALSYLDMAGYFARADWAHAVNAYWSPLYPLLLTLALKIVQPAPYWEFALLHAVNWLIFVVALGCFEFLLRELLRARLHAEQALPGQGGASFSQTGLAALGYALFVWTALFLIGVRQETPDMLMAACVYVMAGLLLRIRRGCNGWLSFIALGVTCGIGYWAKAPLFVLSFVIFAVAVLAAGQFKRVWPRALVALAIFLALCSPWISAISKAKGRLTFGESGRLNFMWVINDVHFLHGQEGADVRGVFAHPPRKLFARPAVYEFATPVAGTYPPWYDPSYWYDGAAGHFKLRGQLAALGTSAAAFYWLFFSDALCGLVAGMLILLWLSKPRAWLTGVWRYAHLLAPALAGLAMFSLIHVEPRYIASFIVLFWLALWASVRLPDGESARRLFSAITFVLVTLLLFITLASSASEAARALGSLRDGAGAAQHEQWRVAQGLSQLGLHPGDRVAVIGDAQRAFWARLGGTPIIADVPEREAATFWAAAEPVKAAVLSALATTGAKVVVADKPPNCPTPSNWQQLNETRHYAYFLSQSEDRR
jgi:4-amino-4-deoxy-L-arabinose transferase-like glycosyltransferase